MDCTTFDASLLDALYDEISPATSTAMDAHAATCEACRGASTKLRGARDAGRAILDEPMPLGLEARILAAAEAAMPAAPENAPENAPEHAEQDKVDRGKVVPLAARARRPASGAIAFLSRPHFAIAAVFLLALGGAVFVQSNKRQAPAASASLEKQESPAEGAAASATPGETTLAPKADEVALAAPAAPPPYPAATPSPVLATRGFADDRPAAAAGGGAPAPVAAAKGKAAEPSVAPPSGPSAGGARSHDPAFNAAKAIYDSGKHEEALPRFEALASTNVEAELYAARCLATTRGCGVAVPRFDGVARRAVGTALGSRAALEAARCTERDGQLGIARQRYLGLRTDPYVANDANRSLAGLDAPRAAPLPAATSTAVRR